MAEAENSANAVKAAAAQPAAVAQPEKKTGGGWKRVVATLISLIVVGWVFAVALPKFASYGQIWDQLKAVSLWELAVLGGSLLLNVAAYSVLWMACTPGLTFSQSVVMTQASAGVNNALPAGGPISMGLIWGMLRSWGNSTTRIVQATTVSGIGNTLVKLTLPVLGVIFLGFERKVDWRLMMMAGIGLAVLAVAIVMITLTVKSERLARRIGRIAQSAVSAIMKIFRKGPITGWDKKALSIRADTVDLLTSRWRQVSLASVGSQLAFFLVLLISLRVMGVDSNAVGFAQVFASFAVIRLVTTIPITPGGVGVTQLGLVGMLAAGAPPELQPNIAAGVMIYTALTYLVTFPLGAICYVVWRGKKSWRTNPDGTPKWSPTA